MLTSADETDLLLPLFGGGQARAPFAAFLGRLLRRTQADHAALVLDEGEFAAGPARVELAGLIRAARLRPGRVYALSELSGGGEIGGDARVLRLTGGEAPAWLVLAREAECSAADAALLSALGPYVAAALAQYRAAQRHAALEQAASTALERAGAGWILLDAEGRVIEIDPALATSGEAVGLRLRPGERLPGAAAVLAAGGGALVLHGAPRIEALLVPSDLPGAAALALCRIARAEGDPPGHAFAALSGLPPREAEFAVALARGGSIADAGAALGLTLETARNYSKQVYAKLGLRGQADLVRRFYESGASLA